MNENRFWEIIEDTWIKSGKDEERKKAIQENDIEELEQLMEFIETNLISYYKVELGKLNKEEFSSYIHTLEKKLFQIDRKEIHEYTDGSDDGFLYCRCFILAMGKEYYNMIDKEPSKAKYDLEAEGFGFEAYISYEDKFKEEFERYSIHSIESCSNPKGWLE